MGLRIILFRSVQTSSWICLMAFRNSLCSKCICWYYSLFCSSYFLALEKPVQRTTRRPSSMGKDCENYVMNNKFCFKYRNFVMSPVACVKALFFFSLAVFQSLRQSSSTWLDSKNFYVFSLRHAHTYNRNHPASRNKTSLEAKRITRMKYTLKTMKKMCEGGKNKNSNKNTIFFYSFGAGEIKNQGHLGQFGNILFTLGSFSAPALTPRSGEASQLDWPGIFREISGSYRLWTIIRILQRKQH